MDTSLIIMSLILVCSVFISFFLFNSVGISERKQIESKIKQIIAEKKLSISKSENWGETYIGLDTNQMKFIFLKIKKSENLEYLLELNALKGCRIMENRKSIKTNERIETLLNRLDLEIQLKNGENIILNFYDSMEDRKEDFELKRIENWKSIFQEQIKTLPHVEKVA
tara:strand:- start:445 stop:948 length:504 start_codon:yes stop_codon:yes gene_type:complete